MNSNSIRAKRFCICLSVLAIAAAIAFVFQSSANAQSPSALTCSSNDGGRKNCPANTQGGVRMTKQLSGTPCIQGSTWGYDANGVWVDHGCRAEFEIQPVQAAASGSAVLTCSSNDGGRKTCPANTQGGVRLTRQISGSSCVQGSTWGYDSTGVWVDKGCRAEFEVLPVPASVASVGASLTCSSNDGGRKTCPANTQGGVRLTRQISGSPCVQGTTWGYDANGVWVDKGCRAEFALMTEPAGNRGQMRVRDMMRRTPSTLQVDPNDNVVWQTSSPNPSVYVQTDGQPETLFAQGASGTQAAAWIERGHMYTFILRDGNGTEIMRTQLDTRARGGYRGRNR